MYAFGALSAELIFAQGNTEREWTIILDTRESRQQHSTRSGNETRSKSQDEHIHTRYLFIQDLVFRILLTLSSVKTDVNPSDIGTKELGRERFHRLRSMLGMGTELSETS